MSTKELAIKLRLQHPDWSLEDIGKQAGVTKQRVSQLLIKSNIPTRKTQSIKKCKQCKKNIKQAIKGFCSLECKEIERFERFNLLLTCKCCEEYFTMKRSKYRRHINVLKQRNFYCSRECYLVDKKDGSI